jgi:hypothetical protein
MSYALQGSAPRLTPRREESPVRTGAIAVRPEADGPSIITPGRRLSLSRARAAVRRRRHPHAVPVPRPRASAGSDVSPMVIGATRGIALLTSR